MDFLHRNNCNKAKCKTCIFRNDGNQLILSKDRMDEILDYLRAFKSSHICHNTNKTCFGALEIQSQLMYRIGIIQEDSVDSMLSMAEKVLNL